MAARILTKRGYRSHFGERLGFLPRLFSRTNPGAIWLHAVSAGEVASAVPLLQILRSQGSPRIPVYLSTSTLAGRTAAERRLSTLLDGIFYAPLDYAGCVRRVLQVLRPSLVIVLETEIWPNLYAGTARTGAALVVLNGRISSRTWPNYRAMRWFFEPILGLPDAIYVQTPSDRDRYLALGAPQKRLRFEGNLKYDASSAPAPSQLPAFGAKRVWVAASTVGPNEAGSVERHSIDEDDLVLDTFEALAAEFPDLLLILAPRQPQRFPVVARKLERRGIRHARRTNLPQSLELPAILLLDTVGELAGAFTLAQVAFVGGSLAPRGGHNILEPAAAGTAVVVGPHMQNFEAMAQDFRDAGALVEVQSPTELTTTIRRLLADPSEAAELGRRARNVVLRNQGVSSRIAQQLWPLYYGAFRSPSRGLISRWMLAPFAWLWRRGGILKRARSIRCARTLPVPVISVGGITIGGSGKTPFTNYLSSLLRRQGQAPGILTRGYRRRSPAEMLILPPGSQIPPAYTGDEAQIFLRAGEAAIGIGSRRYDVGRLLLREFPETTVCLLDDGFQHASLHRDGDIVVIDGLDPFGGGEVVPLGRLREPLDALARASLFVVTRAEQDLRFEAIRRGLQRYNADAPVFRTRLVARHWVDYQSCERVLNLPASRVAAFCGLGNPQSFWSTLESLNLEVVFRWSFPDHHVYRPMELSRIAQQARLNGAEMIVTTEKDRINCPDHLERVIYPFNMAWLEIEFALENEQGFTTLLQDLLRAPAAA
ncbi:MAG TPA: tetraacyldisaccharide 4'-kinase, partial [Bryobacteraceae bacterium]|nr:tetraacyldisaccharide 4'-kinase [Bryobacteraceae bacterium]